MNILIKFWPLFAALGWLLLVYLGVAFYVCRQFTGTWNGLRFLLDRKYWAFALLNHKYYEAKSKGIPLDDFILDFSSHYLMPMPKGVLMRMRESERHLLVMVVSQNDFLQDCFGEKPYTVSRHREICRKWEERLKQQSYGEK